MIDISEHFINTQRSLTALQDLLACPAVIPKDEIRKRKLELQESARLLFGELERICG